MIERYGEDHTSYDNDDSENDVDDVEDHSNLD